MIDVLIPTLRPLRDIGEMVREILVTARHGARIIHSVQQASASVNRNACLSQTSAPIAIMLDDDITGFYPGWDADLLEPLQDERVVIVTARLMRPDGRVAQTCSRCYDLTPETIEIQPAKECVLPTAAIAFRNFGIRFDEHFRGSGFEDGDWCFEYRRQYPDCRFIQTNKCRLVHLNEMKQQREHWHHNKTYLYNKWIRNPQLSSQS
jgi:glycosyltransferase involved in cell wall biosynthesis